MTGCRPIHTVDSEGIGRRSLSRRGLAASFSEPALSERSRCQIFDYVMRMGYVI
jgi:hypothetical protein